MYEADRAESTGRRRDPSEKDASDKIACANVLARVTALRRLAGKATPMIEISAAPQRAVECAC
jgi:hypothetical protein